MATAHLGLLFLVCVAFSFVGKVSPDLKVTVPKCCQIGINWHKEGLKCVVANDYQKPILDVPDSEQELCLKTIQMCCEKNMRQKYCRNGIRMYKTGKKCPSDPNEYYDVLEEKCCNGCYLGAQLGELKIPCLSIDIPIQDELKKAMLNCCSEINPVRKFGKPNRLRGNVTTTAQPQVDYEDYDGLGVPTPAPDNLCDLLPGQLCAQICVPTHGSYYCKCEEGYVLMEDQKTCQKETFQPVKQKAPSTVVPQVIVPNPEKPVPLHKPKGSVTTTTTTVGSPDATPATGTTTLDDSVSCKDFKLCEHECVDTGAGFKCTCREGYAIADDGKSCVDVNECLNMKNTCDLLTEMCVNEIGGYSCKPLGKSGSAPSNLMAPVNGSTAGLTAATAMTASTTTTTTTEKPQLAVVEKELATGECPLGFEEIFGNCTDIDECNYNRYPEVCDSDFECVNTPGSYMCRCKTGFQENPNTHQCEDINECQTNQHNCLASQRCDNSIGSFRCVRFTGCGTGYTLNSQTGQCEDDDECVLKTDNCRFLGPNYICKNTMGSFRCERKRCLPGDSTCDPEKQCPPGYIQGESGNCVDLNECTTGTHNCHPFADECVNRVGGFECRKVVYCPKGYEATANGCMDVNECATKKHNCKGIAECKNEKGSYTCVCPPGFQLAPDNSCEDINECTFYLCPYNSKCVNTPGSYRCDCNVGFENVNENTCQDIDECSVTPGICQHTCLNVFGSFRCTCKSGFRLHENNRTCVDLNECDMFKDQRLCIGECVNIPGSFTCKCPPGYILGPDGRSCQDIDECLRNPCRGEDEVCLNTRGSYRCNSIKCPPNYIKDMEHKNRCKRLKTYCRENDVNCLQQPLTYSFNFVTFVSMLPIPPIGHLDLFTMRGPMWSGTNSQFTLDLLSARAAQKVQAATKESFRLRNSGWNQGVISLVRPIPGPQEIELQLTMKIYHNGAFVGSGVAKLLIHVSEFEY